MKRLLRLLSLAGAVAGAVWYARQQGEQEPAPSGEWAARPDLRAVPDPKGASDRAPKPAGQSPPDDLTEIKGIGPAYARKLGEQGITSFADLAAAEPEVLSESFDPRAAIEDWIAQAKDRT